MWYDVETEVNIASGLQVVSGYADNLPKGGEAVEYLVITFLILVVITYLLKDKRKK